MPSLAIRVTLARMLTGALLIGLLTAYYFGVKPGIVAAAGSALLFIVADIIPALALGAYALVALYIIGVCVVGPRHERAREQEVQGNVVRRWGKRVVGEFWRRL